MQPPGSYVLHTLVHSVRNSRNLLDGRLLKFELNAFCGHKRLILDDQRVLGLLQNTNEVLPIQGIQLNPNWKPALEFRQQVRGLAQVESPCGNEKNMVGADHAVLGGHG